ncbi:MAG: hypothetical protein JNL21_32060 [Myxococcales bacterium]|nr:hypothetical protein [Myxococcales bacterium]
MRARALSILAIVATACGTSQEIAPPIPPSPAEPSRPAAATAALAASSEEPPGAPVSTDADDPELREVLKAVATTRELPIKERVRVTSLGRDALLAKTKKKVAEEIPAGVIDLQGEVLRALGLIPVGYAVEEGLLKLVSARVAGFYDPDDKTMYLLDDLEDDQRQETLPHELVHALQDQSFSIGPLLDYREGETDRSTAIQMLVEGDATSAGFDIAFGSAFSVDEDALQASFLLSTSMSTVGAQTPPVLIGSLIAPYTDGFSFAQALRKHGGWRAIDGAYKELPASTEQILHPEKYFVKEQPVVVPAPSVSALGEGFEAAIVDVNGELGLRLMLEQWTARKVATKAAAGWGGDRYVVARKKATNEHALALFTRMDTQADADELTRVLEGEFGRACRARADLGPVVVKKRSRDVVVVAGPYALDAGGAKGTGTCEVAGKWVSDLLAAVPK